MIAIITLWLACGFLAAGWYKADIEEVGTLDQKEYFGNFNVSCLMLSGLLALIIVIIIRLVCKEAYGWQFPFQRAPFKGHWFKRR